jgi:hypothetical protein
MKLTPTQEKHLAELKEEQKKGALSKHDKKLLEALIEKQNDKG